MAENVVEPEGSIQISTEKYGSRADVTIYFVFDGDWALMYDDEPEDEAEARQWFVREVQIALEDRRSEARQSEQTERPSDPED
jgi:hypothetical protein